MTRARLSILVLLVAATGYACFRPDPAVVSRLRKAVQALSTLDFAGEEKLQLRLDDRDVTLVSELFHRHEDGTRRRRIAEPGKPPDRFGGRFGMGDGGARFGDFLAGAPLHLKLLCRNYQMKLEGEEVVADRRCDKLALRGRQQGRPMIQVWLDKDTGLPLKRCDLAPCGEITAMREITRLQLGERGPDELFSRHPVREHRTIGFDEARALLPGLVKPSTLPAGFELTDITADRRHGNDKVRLTYTDGLVKLVIYEFKASDGDEPPAPPPTREAGLVAQRRSFRDFTVLSSRLGDVRVVICSSLSEDELHPVLQGLHN